VRSIDLESSRPVPWPRPGGAVVSLALHTVIILAAFTTWSGADAGSPDTVEQSAQFLYPLLRPRPRPVEEHISYVGVGGYAAREVNVGKSIAPERKAAEMPAEAPVPIPVPEETPRAYSEIEVDSAAVRDPNSVGPVYPQQLLEARIEGGTTVRFIVDSTGRVDPTSIEVLDSTNPEFSRAVREVLPRMTYQPARMGHRRVAQLVEQRFGFRITPPIG
jgi:TonB family protein